MEVHPRTFENLAKMTRIGSTFTAVSSLPTNVLCGLVRTRTIHAPELPSGGTEAQLHRALADSDTDTPRPRSYRSYQGRPAESKRLFYRDPFPEGLPAYKEPSVNERADIERWRNKQWQREKMLAGREMMDDGMERRRRYTRRERDQMRQHRVQQQYGETMSDLDYRYGSDHRYNVGSKRETRSGYSTPGSVSNDELKLGRNMRAAPRHLVDSRDRVRSVPAVRDKSGSGILEPLLPPCTPAPIDPVVGYHAATTLPPERRSSFPLSHCVGSIYTPQHPSQELIEQLNRQQQLLQQQREERRRFLEGQKIHDPSYRGRSGSLSKDGRLSREEVTQIKNQINGSNIYSREKISQTPKNESGTLTPKSEVGLKSGTSTPAINQILREGRVSVQSGKQSELSQGGGHMSENSAKPSEHSADIFDTNRFEAEGLFQYEENSDKKNTEKEIISDFQQLQTS